MRHAVAPRVPLSDPSDSPGGYTRIPNLHKALAHAPDVLAGWRSLAVALRDALPAERTLLEVAILRVAYLRRSEYVWKNHARAALRLGLGPDKLRVIATPHDGRLLTAGESTYVRLADQIASTGDVDDDVWRELREVATSEQAIRATVTVAFYLAACSITRTLHVPAEPDTTDIEDGWRD